MGDKYISTHYGWCYYTTDRNNPFIYNLYIIEKYRRKGLSKILLEFCIDDIRRSGITTKISIEASPIDDSIPKNILISYYEKFELNVINKED